VVTRLRRRRRGADNMKVAVDEEPAQTDVVASIVNLCAGGGLASAVDTYQQGSIRGEGQLPVHSGANRLIIRVTDVCRGAIEAKMRAR
jgi:hypothetical protein